MGELNGDARIIMERLNQIDRDNKESHQIIFTKIDEVIKYTNTQAVEIAKTSQQAESTQKELSEHKDNEKTVAGLIITTTSIIASAFAWVVSFFRNKS